MNGKLLVRDKIDYIYSPQNRFAMMKKLFGTLLFSLLFLPSIYAQIIIEPGKGINNLKIGSTPDEVVWEMAFKGIKLTKAGVPEVLKIQADMLSMDFDYVYNYQHIMAIPVSTVYFKNDKVVMIVVSSYPEYNEVLCLGVKTKEGLNFWDDEHAMKRIYGKKHETYQSDFDFHYYPELGLSVSIDDKQIRTMTIFKTQ